MAHGSHAEAGGRRRLLLNYREVTKPQSMASTLIPSLPPTHPSRAEMHPAVNGVALFSHLFLLRIGIHRRRMCIVIDLRS